MNPLFRRLAVVLGAVIVLLLILNYQWLLVEIKFRLHPDQAPITNSQNQEKIDPNVVAIPSLGISAPLVYVDQNSEAVFQEALRNGVVHFPGTALPGQPGNAYFFGHSSDYLFSKGSYKTVFALLPHIKPGAEINVSDNQGNLYRYVVTTTVIVSPDDVKYLDQGDHQKELLTLQTSYPVGTALRRFLAIAELKQ